MRKLIALFVLSSILACKKKTEVQYEERYSAFTYEVKAYCDTIFIDSLRYLNAKLEWETLYNAELPFDQGLPFRHTYVSYENDSAALQIFGWGKSNSGSGRIVLSLEYEHAVYTEDSGGGTGGQESQIIHLLGDPPFEEQISYQREL